LWYVVGAPQALHFEQLNAIVRRLGYPVPLTHIPFGSILGQDRKIMRTRSGDNVALDDLLDEAIERARSIVEEKNAGLAPEEKAAIASIIGLGAVKYAELSQHRLTDYIFSWDKMLSFQGNTAPYLQNAYVRVRSIFRRGGLDPEADSLGGDGTLILAEPTERSLALKLARFGETVPAVLDEFRPNLLANYLYELAGEFHSFFEACPVLKAAEGRERATRLTLCQVTARVLHRGLDLLGIEVPDRM
jgi:arginyl-tRNA synthetase